MDLDDDVDQQHDMRRLRSHSMEEWCASRRPSASNNNEELQQHNDESSVSSMTTSKERSMFPQQQEDELLDFSGTKRSSTFQTERKKKLRPEKKSFGTCTTLDESTDETVDSGTSKFRFQHFPASLPRIHSTTLNGILHDECYHYDYSGDEEDHHTADDSTVASSIMGTPVARLNFASAMNNAPSGPSGTHIYDEHIHQLTTIYLASGYIDNGSS